MTPISPPPIRPSLSYSHSGNVQHNPLQLRLYKVLAANFDDEATKDALDTLAEVYAPAKDGQASGSVARSTAGRENDRRNLRTSDDEDSGLSSEEEEEDSPKRALTVDARAEISFVEVEAIPGDVAARARKSLRRDVQNKLAESSRRFLDAFAEVDKQLDTLQEHIASMQTRCDDAQSRLKETNEGCQALLDRAGSLREQRQTLTTHQNLLRLFLSRFTLTIDELASLTSREVPVGKAFFSAMARGEKVLIDSRVLLTVGSEEAVEGVEEGRAGLDIIAKTSAALGDGYEKLLRYLSFEFRRFAKSTSSPHGSGMDVGLEVSPTMREGVRWLRKRPDMLEEALNLLTQTRRTALLNAFTTALTRGAPTSGRQRSTSAINNDSSVRGPRPIELHAHDPMRYVGDMLAWVHQALAAEREFVDALFGIGEDEDDPTYSLSSTKEGSTATSTPRPRRRMPGEARHRQRGSRNEGESEEEVLVDTLVSTHVSALCPPLKVRVEQTIRSQESTLVVYKLASLVRFYGKVLGASFLSIASTQMGERDGEEGLVGALRRLTEFAYRAFFDGIEAQGRSLLRMTLDPDDPSVTPPLQLLDHAQVLREVLVVFEGSLEELEEDDTEWDGWPVSLAPSNPQHSIQSFDSEKRDVDEHNEDRNSGEEVDKPTLLARPILDRLLDPALEVTIVSSSSKEKLRPGWDASVFVVNCLGWLRDVLDPFPFTKEKKEMIGGVLEGRVVRLIEEHYTNLLRDSGLGSIIDAWKPRQGKEPLSHLPGASPQSLKSALQTFSQFLSSNAITHPERLSPLSSPYLTQHIHREALRRLGQAYEHVCIEVRKEENRYEAGATVLGSERPFGVVRLLWQIFGIEEEENEGVGR